jgi:hypothetical protein
MNCADAVHDPAEEGTFPASEVHPVVEPNAGGQGPRRGGAGRDEGRRGRMGHRSPSGADVRSRETARSMSAAGQAGSPRSVPSSPWPRGR